MHRLEFRTIDHGDLPLLQYWFEDEEWSRWLGFTPTGDWLNFVSREPNRHTWVILERDEVVGMADIETENGIAHILVIVAPDRQNRGYGTQIALVLPGRPEFAAILSFHAGIHYKNVASLRCFLKAGFKPESDVPDDDGFLNLFYRPAP